MRCDLVPSKHGRFTWDFLQTHVAVVCFALQVHCALTGHDMKAAVPAVMRHLNCAKFNRAKASLQDHLQQIGAAPLSPVYIITLICCIPRVYLYMSTLGMGAGLHSAPFPLCWRGTSVLTAQTPTLGQAYYSCHSLTSTHHIFGCAG